MIKTKDDRGHALKVRLIGLLEHNQLNKLRLFTLTEEYPTGANHVVEAIHRYLSERVNQSVLPKTLYIQVDNCTKENKNRYLFSYVESLIRWKLFEEIEVAFLPVGHTHEDIDQCFSRTSDRLRCHDAFTLQDLIGELRHVYNNQTSVVEMNNVVNWSGLCENESCLTNLKNFSKYRYFKFYGTQGELSSNSSSSTGINCLIKVNSTDSWVNISTLGARGTIFSFTKFAPDLRKTPDLKIKCPDGKGKVSECIEEAESRIGSVEKIDALLQLRDKVFKERVESFHWDLNNMVEWNSSVPLREEDDDSENGPEVEEQELSISEDEEPAGRDYRYELNSFVAIKSEEEDNNNPFWIAKVICVHKNDQNIISMLTVHWFDKAGKQDIYNGKYFPSYNNIKKKGIKRSPMRDNVSTQSVIINFERLTKQNKLPAAVAQHLRTI